MKIVIDIDERINNAMATIHPLPDDFEYSFVAYILKLEFPLLIASIIDCPFQV